MYSFFFSTCLTFTPFFFLLFVEWIFFFFVFSFFYTCIGMNVNVLRCKLKDCVEVSEGRPDVWKLEKCEAEFGCGVETGGCLVYEFAKMREEIRFVVAAVEEYVSRGVSVVVVDEYYYMRKQGWSGGAVTVVETGPCPSPSCTSASVCASVCVKILVCSVRIW